MTGQRIGYVRVSTLDQNEKRQLEGQVLDRLFTDKASGRDTAIQITRHGHPSAVLMSADDLESLQETIHWLSRPGIREDLEQARRDIAEENTTSGADLRREFGLPPR